MKPRFIKTILFFAAFMMVASLANAQLIATNNLGAFDPSGPFDLNGKFTSLGESGGVPGATPTGCDLYGFRSQLDSLNSVNLGMQVSGTLRFPALSFQGLPFVISQAGPTGAGGTGDFGCGDVIAAYFDSQPPVAGITNIVYSVFGSAFASNGVWVPSDRKAKKEIEPIANATDLVKRLNGVTYEYKTEAYPEKNFKEGRQYGFVAQEVAEILPEAVQNTPDLQGGVEDIIVMNYDMIIPVLTEALKAQLKTIETLEDRLAQLEERAGTNTKPSIDPKGDTDVSLEQNRPNPFKGITTIEYNIPNTMTNARLVIYASNGSVVETIALAPGNGTVDYNAGRLSAGVYYYAIEVDGRSLARQTMILK